MDHKVREKINDQTTDRDRQKLTVVSDKRKKRLFIYVLLDEDVLLLLLGE